MPESGSRFVRYFPLLIDALRAKHPDPMRPKEALAWIRSKMTVPSEDLTRHIQNGKQTIFENDVHWARFYLAEAGIVDRQKRGWWGLTEKGFMTTLNVDEAQQLFEDIHKKKQVEQTVSEDNAAPDIEDADEGVSYWFAGAVWNGTNDQLPRFLEQGIWENGYDTEFTDQVKSVQIGDKIAVKAAFTQKKNLPFEVGGKVVSVMRIKATGTVTGNPGDGKQIQVAWDKQEKARDWYFYTYRTTLTRADTSEEACKRLVDFTFNSAIQDYAWFLDLPYFKGIYGDKAKVLSENPVTEVGGKEDEEVEDTSPYLLENVIDDGCFLGIERLNKILGFWKQRKNVILQGPPGTGKTWLARRLALALIGSTAEQVTQSRLRSVQFHPSLSYEDFVRGWRPTGKGELELKDGIMMEAIDAARAGGDEPYVLVIEEINRGNPAQILGEMLTLLEDTKRTSDEAISLAYKKTPNEKVYIPENLYVIGTMNVADRSLAIVDFALRRRFGFFELEPQLGPAWQKWCKAKGLPDDMIEKIKERIENLNTSIQDDHSLGRQFRIGHSFVTPDKPIKEDPAQWFRDQVEYVIAPLLEEYWFDKHEQAAKEKEKLLEGLS